MFNLFKRKHKATIYIIDDEEELCEAYMSLLKDRYDVRVAHFIDPLKAMEALKKVKVQPALILCDIMMPGIKGLQLRETLIKEGVNIPFIFISALSGENLFEEKYTILTKPVNLKLLYDEVEKHLPQ